MGGGELRGMDGGGKGRVGEGRITERRVWMFVMQRRRLRLIRVDIIIILFDY